MVKYVYLSKTWHHVIKQDKNGKCLVQNGQVVLKDKERTIRPGDYTLSVPIIIHLTNHDAAGSCWQVHLAFGIKKKQPRGTMKIIEFALIMSILPWKQLLLSFIKYMWTGMLFHWKRRLLSSADKLCKVWIRSTFWCSWSGSNSFSKRIGPRSWPTERRSQSWSKSNSAPERAFLS